MLSRAEPVIHLWRRTVDLGQAREPTPAQETMLMRLVLLEDQLSYAIRSAHRHDAAETHRALTNLVEQTAWTAARAGDWWRALGGEPGF